MLSAFLLFLTAKSGVSWRRTEDRGATRILKFAATVWPLLAASVLSFGLSQPALAKSPTQTVLRVENVDQLLQALGPNRTIQLQPGVYHLMPGLQTTPYVKWKSAEQPTLVIQKVKNLNIIGQDAARTKLVSTRCKGDLLDFEASSAVRMQGIGFGRMSPGELIEELDCSMGERGAEVSLMPDFKPDAPKIRNWQQLAREISLSHSRGIELPSYTHALYPKLVEQVSVQTKPIEPAQDPIKVRHHSMRPQLGEAYRLTGKRILDSAQKPAQAAAMVFDRSQNLLAVFDKNAQVILAVEGRNNTRQSWSQSADWLMQKSMVPQSNAPAPNGVYAFGQLIKDSPTSSHSFGSYRIVIEGGILTNREILFHSRDHVLTKEIPWAQDINDEQIRTLGCFLFQDPDLNLLAQLLLDADQPVALAVQGSYAKNIKSPELSL